MRTTLLVLLIALTSACNNADISPRLTADITLQRINPTTVLVKVHVKNDGDRATVPIDVAVTTDAHLPVIHPAAFVLNHQEVRTLATALETSAAVHATLTIKEAERGLGVVTKSATVD